MPANSKTTGRTTRSVTRKGKERTQAFVKDTNENSAEATTEATARPRTRSAGASKTPAATAPSAEGRNRTRSAPAVLGIRVTRSQTAAERLKQRQLKPIQPPPLPPPLLPPGPPPLELAAANLRTRSLNALAPSRFAARFSSEHPLLPAGNARHPRCSTPMSHSSQNAADYAKFEVLKRVVLMELGNSIELVDESYAKDLYADLIDDKKIKTAFKKIGYSPRKKYGGGLGRWNEIPDAAKKESELYPIFLKITSSVLETLGTHDAKNTRIAVDTHSMHFTHLDNSTHYSKPDISILATGPSFELPYAKPGATKPTIGYTNIAAFMEVKREGDEGTDEDLIQQTGVYSRQMFIQQPNRKFVRTAVLTEHNIRVIHFDRSGVRYTPWIDFHKDPYTFVRIILGLSSIDEDVLGLDTSIQWTIGKEGRKVAGTIKMVDTGMDEEEREELTFDLLDVHPVFIRAALRGRGTTCWSARSRVPNAEGKRVNVLIKDAWRSGDRVPEYAFLKQARGVVGVTRMLHYEDYRAETKYLRGLPLPISDDELTDFFNRIWLRVVTEQHGPSLKHFKSQKQAIAALRDALLAHRNLILLRNILHRDISIQNILLGLVDEDALPGLRGILIDLDMAINTGPRDVSDISAEHRTGTRMYQSISVLTSYLVDHVHLAHDYLDDLESFFYVAVYLMFGWSGAECEQAKKPEFLATWDHDDPIHSRNAKVTFITEALNLKPIPSFWTAPCRELLRSFHKFVRGIVSEKADIRGLDEPEERLRALEQLHEGFEDHYNSLKAMFDKALKDLDVLEQKERAQAQTAAVAGPRPEQPAIPGPSFNPPRVSKRGSDSVEDDIESPSKRTRTTVGARSRLANTLNAKNQTSATHHASPAAYTPSWTAKPFCSRTSKEPITAKLSESATRRVPSFFRYRHHRKSLCPSFLTASHCEDLITAFAFKFAVVMPFSSQTQLLLSTQDPRNIGTHRKRVYERLIELKEEIEALESHYNSLSLPNRIPPEILSKIFLIVASYSKYKDEDDDDYNEDLKWIRVMHVCRYWRETALNCVALWSQLSFVNPEFTEFMIDKSRNAPLSIECGWHSGAAKFQDVLCKALSRTIQLRRVTLACCGDSDRLNLPPLLALLSGPLPILEDIAISMMEDGPVVLPARFLDGTAPNLKSLKLYNITVGSWTDLPLRSTLTRLHFETNLLSLSSLTPTPNGARPSWVQLLTSLQDMASLESLTLEKVLPSDDLPTTPPSTYGPTHPVTLHKLRSLKLVGFGSSIVNFCTVVRFPKARDIQLIHVDPQDIAFVRRICDNLRTSCDWIRNKRIRNLEYFHSRLSGGPRFTFSSHNATPKLKLILSFADSARVTGSELMTTLAEKLDFSGLNCCIFDADPILTKETWVAVFGRLGALQSIKFSESDTFSEAVSQALSSTDTSTSDDHTLPTPTFPALSDLCFSYCTFDHSTTSLLISALQSRPLASPKLEVNFYAECHIKKGMLRRMVEALPLVRVRKHCRLELSYPLSDDSDGDTDLTTDSEGSQDLGDEDGESW
ncbi:hypothetical protein NMY22_g17129 [Coprinellus aureogranulatus]|nr:hypothetical protein NMY22_g17129 [Coprinellus aureogranulatus]